MSKEWAGKTLLGLIFYYVLFISFATYAPLAAEKFGVEFGGSITSDVNLTETFDEESTCDYPRYRYNSQGEPVRYYFDLDNLNCDISAGVIAENSCTGLNGCEWGNVTTGWWLWSSTSESCFGDINKTFYNDGVETNENICEVLGLQGNDNVKECVAVGCTSYKAKNDASSGVKSPLVILSTVGNLFTFRYDFGLTGENASFWNFVITFVFVYIAFFTLLMCIYLLSPLSN